MHALIRHSTQRCRTWLIALAAILLVTSILEAGHAHGVFSAEEDHCSLCQHAIALDKVLPDSLGFIQPLLLNTLACASYIHFTPGIDHYFALIRAPPNNAKTAS